TFNVDKGCHLRVIETTKTDLQRIAPNTFNIAVVTHTLAGDQPPQSTQIKISPPEKIDHFNPLTGKIESFNGIMTLVVSRDRILITMGIYYSPTTTFNFSRAGNLENLSVNEVLWDQAPLTVYE